MEPRVSNQSQIQPSDGRDELIELLCKVCDENPNDQILGFKIRILVKSLKNGQNVNPDQIKFVN